MCIWSNLGVNPQANAGWDVLLDLDHSGHAPLHRRIAHALREAVRSGRIPVGEMLPPSRELAIELRCSRWAVTEAYGQLVAEGYLEARTGSGTRVRWSADEPPPARCTTPRGSPAMTYDLAPGLPDLRAFPRRQWADAVRAQLIGVDHAELGHPDAGGHRHLRARVAEYLQRSRGATASAEDVTICESVRDGVRRVCRALATRGIDTVACEEPGWTPLREVVGAAGLQTVPIPVDEDGLRVEVLRRRSGLRAVLTTPAHQFPMGTVLSADRRADLLRWARQVDGVVLEDDYDAEFRYERRPVGTVQGMDPSRVILLKSLSKMLSPAMGIGWIVAAGHWSDLLRSPETGGATPPTLDQLAFAHLLDTGAYDRHLRACRRRYRHRRTALIDALRRHLPGPSVTGVAAGLHLLIRFPDRVDTARIVAAAARRSVEVTDLRGYYADARDAPAGLVLGYGNLADGNVEDAVRELAAVVADQTRRPARRPVV